jgi:hypothetical protein
MTLGFLGRRWRFEAGGDSAREHGLGEHRTVSGARRGRSGAPPRAAHAGQEGEEWLS